MSARREHRNTGDEVVGLELLTVVETARALKISPATVRRLISSGRLAAIHIGRSVRVPRDKLEAMASQDPSATVSQASAITPGRPLTLDDPIFELMGIACSDGPGDVAENPDRYLAEATLTTPR